jgi:hypothetical protein
MIKSKDIGEFPIRKEVMIYQEEKIACPTVKWRATKK